MRLSEYMVDKQPIWESLVKEHELVPTPWAKLVNWSFFDNAIAPGVDVIVSNIKIRQAGFAHCFDTEERFKHWIARLCRSRRPLRSRPRGASSPSSIVAPSLYSTFP